jgi:hypothetical protein
MSGPALLQTIAFLAVVAGILLAVWTVLVLESRGHPPAREHQTAMLSDERGDVTAPEREAA